MSGYTVQEKYDHLVRALRTAHTTERSTTVTRTEP